VVPLTCRRPRFICLYKVLLPVFLPGRGGADFDSQSPTQAGQNFLEVKTMTKLKKIIKEVLGIFLILITLALIMIYFYQVLFSKVS
jgi:hypothetical protein